MKKNLLYVALLLGSITFAQAQPGNRNPRTPEDMAKRQTEMLEKKLSLTNDQKQKVYDIQLSAAKSRDSLMTIRKNGNQDRASMFSAMKSIQANHDAKIASILNDTQKSEYQKMLSERKSRMENRQRGQNSGE